MDVYVQTTSRASTPSENKNNVYILDLKPDRSYNMTNEDYKEHMRIIMDSLPDYMLINYNRKKKISKYSSYE